MDRTDTRLSGSIQSVLSSIPMDHIRKERNGPSPEDERDTLTTGVPRTVIVEARLWNKRTDGITIRMTTKDKQGEFVILKFKRMSDVTENYLSRAKDKEEEQYVSLKSALERSLGPQGWTVNQVSFITGARSLNE